MKEIRRLLKKYDEIAKEDKIGKYNEEMTKKDFILPLFRALGWNVEDSNEVTAEEKISKKRVDYGFRIDGIPKFFLEAKSLKVDLDDEKFFEQAISYAWHKGCTWAVLTDFEAVKILNAEWKAANYLQSHFTTIRSREFLKRFDELWLLSKDSFEQGLLDKEAEKWGKKSKKTSIDKQLLADFTRFRGMLSRSITKLNQSKNLTEEELDESVQRILDRLIFIRNCEDRELEAKTLISGLREWRSKGRGQLVKSMRQVFDYFNKEYNSKIFAEHLCDHLEIEDAVLYEVAMGLYYTKEKFFSISYDFSAIDADVLGNIYEQYLSHILKKTEKRAKLTESRIHRKKQGIYYTPTYIVDYIVRNTLGELLKDKRTVALKIRVLDPACGSGSFLIKAFDILNEYYRSEKDYTQTRLDFKTGIPFTKKVRILQNNIFGVDLDKQAVEIAQLNLLLKIAEKGRRLPFLEQNIKCGNSLIDDKKIVGNKAFKWKEEFEEIMKEGGFDVVIGNPPYVPIEMFSEKEKNHYFESYKSPYRKFDTSMLFIEKAITLLKDGGYLGVIVPLTWQTGENYIRFREVIFSKCSIKCVINLPFDVFQDAYVDTGIFILQKGKKEKSRFIAYSYDKKKNIQRVDDSKCQNIEQQFVDDEPKKKVFTNRFVYTLMKKMKKNSVLLGEITNSCQGVVVSKFEISDSRINESYKKLLTKGAGDRYSLQIQETKYIDYDKVMRLYRYYSQPRIFIRRIVNRQNRLMAFYLEEPLITKKDYNPFIVTNRKYNILYLLGLINSKLFSYIYVNSSALALKDDFRQTTLSELRKLPIKISSEKYTETVINLVRKMQSLNERFNEIGDKLTDERTRIENEIKKTDGQIDELVYKIYGITEAEKQIIEESSKTK